MPKLNHYLGFIIYGLIDFAETNAETLLWAKRTFHKNKHFSLVDTDVTNLTKLTLYFYHFSLIY